MKNLYLLLLLFAGCIQSTSPKQTYFPGSWRYYDHGTNNLSVYQPTSLERDTLVIIENDSVLFCQNPNNPLISSWRGKRIDNTHFMLYSNFPNSTMFYDGQTLTISMIDYADSANVLSDKTFKQN